MKQPKTWHSEERLTAAMMNTELRDNLVEIQARLETLEPVVEPPGKITKVLAACGLVAASGTVKVSRRGFLGLGEKR